MKIFRTKILFEKIKIHSFQKSILSYYEHFGRKHFLWRKTTDPWKILLAEFLLRKTTANQAHLVYTQLESLSPTDILKLNTQKLIKILQPLGIQNQRARLLKGIIKKLNECDMSIYRDIENLEKIPGIGRYTTNAIQCFAFNLPYPIVDRNVIRIMSRVFSKTSLKKRPHLDNELWNFASKVIYPKKPKEYNWGVLDLSAEFCRPNKPHCDKCPIKRICNYYQRIK